MVEQQLNNIPSYNEIDIIDFLRDLWLQKWVILLIALASVIAAYTYVSLSKSVYEAKAYILPPTEGDIIAFNYSRLKKEALKPFKISTVYRVFTNTLLSQSTKQAFFYEVYLPSLSAAQRNNAQDKIYNEFNNALTIKENGRFRPSKYEVIARGYNPAQTAELVKGYVAMANQKAVEAILTIVDSQNAAMARHVVQQISMARELAKERRTDRLTQLHEALTIAEAVGLDKHVASTGDIYIESKNLGEPSLMYKRGSIALKAEMGNLNARQNDDAFIPQLRKLQMRLSFLQNNKVNLADVAVFRLDGNIEVPSAPVSPRKKLIIVLSLMLSLLAGVTGVLIRSLSLAKSRRILQ